jgi:hypothetical protein
VLFQIDPDALHDRYRVDVDALKHFKF